MTIPGQARYGLALLIVGSAVALRWLADPWLGEKLPLLTLFVGVVLASGFCRWRAVLAAAVAGFFLINFLFVAPRYDLTLSPKFLTGLVIYLALTGLVIALGEKFHRARERAELALAQREERERQLLEQARLLDLSNDTIFVRDEEERIIYWNRGAEETYGYSREEAMGNVTHDLLKTEFPEPLEQIRAVLTRERRWSGELVHTRRDGQRIVVSSRWALDCGSDGQPVHVLETNNDITKRKQAEVDLHARDEQLREAQRLARLGSWHWDARSNHIIGSDELYRIYGLDPSSGPFPGFNEQRGTLYPEESWQRIHTSIGASVETGEKCEMEVEAFCGSERIWITTRSEAVRDGEGRIIGLRGTVQNITERKRTETAMLEAKEQAEHASRAKDDFLAQLSHELRTPLTPVLMTAAALEDDDTLPPHGREALAMIARNVTLEARLIDDLLDLTRITRGKFSLRTELCDLHSLIVQAVDIICDEAREKQVSLDLALSASRRHLTGDPARLQQVFWNLLRNAVKFTPRNGRVRIATQSIEPDSERILIEVSDNGVGFNAGEAESLFTPFHQAPHNHGTGLGLGLAIARAIVDAHGGAIRGHSAGPGLGATFSIELPVTLSPQTESTNSPGATNSARDDLPEPSMRLLVVEDHEPTLQVLARLLARAGHQVTSARSLDEAQSAASAQAFDIVVSDLGLPDGSGIDLMHILRSRHGLRGVALSGYGMDEDIRRSREAGFAAHLVKPVNVNELRHALRQLAATVVTSRQN